MRHGASTEIKSLLRARLMPHHTVNHKHCKQPFIQYRGPPQLFIMLPSN